MDYEKITQQMLNLNKTSFDNSFNAMNLVCEQNRKMAESFLSQAAWIPDEGKKAYKDWMSAMCTGANDLKKMVDENYTKVEEYFDRE